MHLFGYFYAPGPDLFLSGLFLRLKLGLPVGLGRPVARRGLWPLLTQSGNPNFNTQKEVLVLIVVLALGDERKGVITPG
jgi:hypothetical protein